MLEGKNGWNHNWSKYPSQAVTKRRANYTQRKYNKIMKNKSSNQGNKKHIQRRKLTKPKLDSWEILTKLIQLLLKPIKGKKKRHALHQGMKTAYCCICHGKWKDKEDIF